MDSSTARNVTLRSLGIIGATIFSFFFMLTYLTPTWVEGFASDYIEREASKRVDGSIDAIQVPKSDSALARLAQSMYEKNEAQVEARRKQLRDNVHKHLAGALAQIRDLDCECRKKTEQWLEEGFKTDIRLLQATSDRIVDFIQYKYTIVTQELKRDIRIFSASNASAFLLLLLVSFLKPRAMVHLFLPGVLLAISTFVCSYFYIFEQNWLLTIIHNEYLGFAYLAWLGFVFLIFCDIVLNRARITTEIVNGVLNAVGSALSVVPC